MKITGVRTFLMQAGSPGETAWSAAGRPGSGKTGASFGSSRNWLFVKIDTDAGITGIGECSGWPRVVETAVKDLAVLLIGEDPQDIERLWQKLYVAQMGHGLTGVVGAGAITGLDMALWDIKGKALGTPVWNLLGGRVRDRIRLYGHASTPAKALSLKARGYTAVKAGGVAGTVAKVAAIRDAVGAEMDLMVDLHGPPWLTPADAIAMGRALAPFNLLFLEDPVAPDNLDAFARVRDALDLPLAAGERFATIWGARPLIERELVDVIQPDTGRFGGLSQLRKLAAMAEAHHITVAPHSGSLGPVAEFAAIHLLAAIPNALMLERVEDDWPERDTVITAPPVIEAGHALVPTAPGLGVDIDEAAVARFPSRRNVGDAAGQYEPGTEREHLYVQTRFRRSRAFEGSKP
ncbi:MAG: mandelate racemase/muconate lactonizing enzyme family protein [Alphaproteobacteria bacterium]|nr:mandelate racemase/muconate lactonizing enzyme family protein [Alphaproteobacteria bacterium]